MVAVMYLLGFNGQWRIERDSALYLTVGRNLAEGRGYTYRDQQNHLIYPGLPLMLAGLDRLFHTSGPLPPLIAMLLLGWATLGLTYRLFSLYAGRRVAVLITLGVAATRIFYRYCFELLTDLPFLLGVMAFLAGYEAIFGRASRASARRSGGEIVDADDLSERAVSGGRWFDWALLLAGLCITILMRPMMWTLVGAAALTQLVRAFGGRRRGLHLVIFLAVMAAVGAFYFFDLRGGPGHEDYERAILNRLSDPAQLSEQVRANASKLFEATLIKALFGCPLGHVLNVAIGIAALGLGVSLFWHREIWGFLFVLTVGAQLIFEPVDRYFVAVIPLMVFAWWRLLAWISRLLPVQIGPVPVGGAIFLALFATGMGTNIGRISELIAEQRRTPFQERYHNSRYRLLGQIVTQTRRNTTDADWILVDPNKQRILTYETRRNFFETIEPPPKGVDLSTINVLRGPSWDEPREGMHAGERSGFGIDAWLAAHHLKLAEAPIRTFDVDGWALYRVKPAG